jgi:hypothetical protein
MAIGDKSFTTEVVRVIEGVVDQNTGNAATIDRVQGEVVSIDSVNSVATVNIDGSATDSGGFRIRSLQFPSAGDLVMVAIDGDERWIESVVRPVGTSAYPSITLDWVNNRINLVGSVNGGGVVTETGIQTLTSKTLSNPAFSYTTAPTVALTGPVTGSGSLSLNNAGTLSITTTLATDSVGSAQIAAGAVGSSEIASLAVDTAELAALSVTTAKIDDLAVTTGKINDLAVTTGKIAALAVTDAKIAANTITGASIASGAISASELSSSISITTSGTMTPTGTADITSTSGYNSVYMGGSSGVSKRFYRFTGVSEARLKENIAPTSVEPEQIYALKPIDFNFKESARLEYPNIEFPTTRQWGLTVEDTREVFPSAISGGQNGDPYGIHWERIYYGMLVAVIDLNKRVKELESKVEELSK